MIEKKYYKTKEYCKVKFTVEAEAKKVELFGLNNEWKKGIALVKKKDGSFAVEMNIDKGTQHEFKYLVDKKIWLNDEQADAQAANVFGTTNSVVVI
jgi:1,4-alpha-glucan branching enzyme